MGKCLGSLSANYCPSTHLASYSSVIYDKVKDGCKVEQMEYETLKLTPIIEHASGAKPLTNENAIIT